MKHNKKGTLLASFIADYSEQQIMEEVQYIADNLNLTNNTIFLLSDTNNPEKKVLTYNAEISGSGSNARLYTTRIHRKKQTNTLYTINALNAALALEHDGQSGKHLKLDWEKYSNSILLITGKKLRVHPVEVVKIFKIEDEPEEK
tara:strand:- start:35 stop:469 length:435 start_codon:yes stop_codon:yes gene_type:complete